MSAVCAVDSYYTTVFTGDSAYCGSDPSCSGAPEYQYGYNYIGKNSCGDCSHNSVDGVCALCTPKEPPMDDQAKLNCCLSTNIPNNNPHGYCQTDFCINSDSCNSFFTSYCQGSNLETDDCEQFCNSDSAQANGVCNSALIQYCSLPENNTKEICGCALPAVNSNYPGITDSDPSLPIACYNKCNSNTNVIKLSTLDACSGTFCITSDITINAINSTLGNITLNQACGNSDNTDNTNNSFLTSITNIFKSKWLYLILGAILLLIVVIIIIVIATRNRGDDNEDEYQYVVDQSSTSADVTV